MRLTPARRLDAMGRKQALRRERKEAGPEAKALKAEVASVNSVLEGLKRKIENAAAMNDIDFKNPARGLNAAKFISDSFEEATTMCDDLAPTIDAIRAKTNDATLLARLAESETRLMNLENRIPLEYRERPEGLNIMICDKSGDQTCGAAQRKISARARRPPRPPAGH